MRKSFIVLATAASLVLAAGCASVPRQPALDLADAGQQAARAVELQKELSLEQRQAVHGFDVFLTTVDTCLGAMQRERTAGRPPENALCPPETPPAENVQQAAAVTQQLELRERAAAALGRAYGAFRREAETDNAAALDAALGEAATSVNALGAALGLGPIPGIVTGVGRSLGGAWASEAERTRLVAGSRGLRAATAQLAEAQRLMLPAITAERARYLRSWRLLRRTLVAGNVVKDDPDLAAAATAAGLGTLRPEPPPRDLRAGAEAFSEVQRERSLTAALAAFTASTQALQELDDQHADFEAGRPLSLEDLALRLEDVAARVRQARTSVD